MTAKHYDTATRALHWVIALLVVGVYAVGLIREGLPKGDFRTWLLMMHMSVGLAVMALMALRLGWRMAAPPLEPVPMKPVMALGAKLAHVGLYMLVFALPVIGLAAAWFKGRTVGFFGLPLASPFVPDRALAHTLEGAHEVLGHMLMLLAGLHAAAALYHHHVLKDATLARMIPRLERTELA